MDKDAAAAVRPSPVPVQPRACGVAVVSGIALVSVLVAASACTVDTGSGNIRIRREAPYQSEVEEGLGVTLAILVDTSGSMEQFAAGDSRPKHEVASAAIEHMLQATDDFLERRPDFPVRITIYNFSSSASRIMPVRDYDSAAIREALRRIPRPGGGTAIGEAMRKARPELYRGGTFRKYLMVVTDGENTSGRDPAKVAREIYRKSEGAVGVYFIAFDTSPEKFGFLKDAGGEVVAAGNGAELGEALDEIYRGKILAEEVDVGEL